MYPVGIAVFLVLVCLPWPASARCDCSSKGWVSGCTATIKGEGEGVLISSSSMQCSRVDWYLGSAPQVSVFWGGREWESIAKVTGRPSITVESCRVCKDEKADDSAARAAAAPAQALRVVSMPAPRYPPEALRSGTSGEVLLGLIKRVLDI